GVRRAREIAIDRSCKKLVEPDCRDDRPADLQLAGRMPGGIEDGSRGQLRLEHGRKRARPSGQFAARPVELWCVDGRQMYLRDTNAGAFVSQLDPQRVGKGSQRMLGGAV